VLTKSFEERQVHIAFRPHDETFEVTDAAIAKDPEFISDITALWRPDGYKSSFRQFVSRLGDARGQESDDREQDHLEERIDRVRDLRDFRFQVIELGAGVNEEQVAEIFVRVNSKGVQLNQADFILTLMSVHWEKGRRELEAFCREAVDPVGKGPSPRNAFIDPSPDQLLRAGVGLAFRRGRLQHVYSILRGKDLETGEVSADRRDVQFEQLRVAQDDVIDLTNWFEFLKCLTHAGFRSRRMITSENALIYTYILWLIGRRDFGIDLKTLRGVIARWFFMAHTTGRYTSSPESQIEADLARINTLAPGDGAAFCADLDGNVRARFTGDYWAISLPNRLDTASARSPVLYAYWAALSLLDAELLFSGLRIRELLDPSVSAPRSIERHHLFLKAFLAGKGTVGIRAVNAIAHMAFLDWPDNATISADDPLAYWPIMTERMDEAQLKRQVYWHALPVGWEQLDYPTFLDRRRQLIARVVRDGPPTSTATCSAATSFPVSDRSRSGGSRPSTSGRGFPTFTAPTSARTPWPRRTGCSRASWAAPPTPGSSPGRRAPSRAPAPSAMRRCGSPRPSRWPRLPPRWGPGGRQSSRRRLQRAPLGRAGRAAATRHQLRDEHHHCDSQARRGERQPLVQPAQDPASRRTVGIPSFVAGSLAMHIDLYALAGEDGLVFPSAEGMVMRRSNFRRRVWEPATAAVAMTGFRFHDLRHTASTLAAASGTSLRALMARIGHASARAALRYQNVIDGQDADIVRYLEQFGEAPPVPPRAQEAPPVVGTRWARNCETHLVRSPRKPLTRAFLVETTGLEPATPCLQSRCSSHLSYVPWPAVLTRTLVASRRPNCSGPGAALAAYGDDRGAGAAATGVGGAGAR